MIRLADHFPLGLALSALPFVASPAAAQIDAAANIRQAVADCAAFIAAKSTDVFEEPGFEMAGDVLFEQTEERLADGLTLTFTNFVPAAPQDAGALDLPDNWQCAIRGSGLSRPLWRAAGVGGLFADASALIPTLDARKAEDGRWTYQDCADPEAPVDYTFRLSDRGDLWVQAQYPALDTVSCRDLIEVNRVFYACVYAFAEEPWARIRETSETGGVPGQVTLHHRETLDDLVNFAPGASETRRGTVETEIGPIQVTLTGDAPTTECRVQGTARADTVFDWLISASTFYDGGFFRFDGGRGLYTCAPSFPNVAMFLAEQPLDGGDVAFDLTMESRAYPVLQEMCAG